MNKKVIKKRLLYIFCGALLVVAMYMASYSCYYGTKNSDYFLHYNGFAMKLPLLKQMGVDRFLNAFEFARFLSYPVWHICCYGVNLLIGIVYEADGRVVSSIVTSMFEMLAYVACVWGMKRLCKKNYNYFEIGIGALIILLMGPVKIPGVPYYLGKICANVWHNPTIIAVKAVSIICFVLYVKIFEMEFVGGQKNNKKYIWASVFLVISAFCKPSFYQMFVPGLALACLVELIRTKGKAFRFCLKMLASVIPVLLIAIVQMQINFTEQESSIRLGLFKTLSLWTNHPIMSILISMPFPLCIIIFSVKELIHDKKMMISVCTFLSGLLQYILLYQTRGMTAGDFAWGAYLGMGILNLATLCKMFEKKDEWRKWKICIGVILLLTQLVSGMAYVGYVIKTGTY